MPIAALSFALTLLLPLLPATAQGSRQVAPFTMAVLRSDGAAIPFAAFDGSQWSSPWPRDLGWEALPLRLADVPLKWWGKGPPALEATLWTDGVAGPSLRFDAPVMTAIACARRMALRSDFKPEENLPLRFEQPYPKAGLVVTGAARVDPIESVPAGTPDRAYIGDMLGAPFEAAERVAAGAFTAWRHPVAPAERRRVALEIEALYRAPMDASGWTAYYVEAVKRYPARPRDNGCGLVTYVSGWIGLDEGNRRWFSVTGRVTYCDRMGVSYMLPLGRMTLNGRTYWIYQRAGYDAEHYAVSRPTIRRAEHEVIYSAAACRYVGDITDISR